MTIHTGSSGTIERLYVLNGGLAVAPDRSMYTPGYGQGEPITLSCHAYLIRRGDEWLLWDTGIADELAEAPDGQIIAHTIRGLVTKTIREQLAAIGLTPGDINTVVLSHAHFDHIGNAGLFPGATWYIQNRECEAMFGPNVGQYGYLPALYGVLKAARVERMAGDLDLFGDSSVRVISTPGHTPGHCSLLVRLAKTGAVLLSGDVAHNQYNMQHRCVPTFNSDPEQSRRSMERVASLVSAEGAQLWLNHDPVQAAVTLHAPVSYE